MPAPGVLDAISQGVLIHGLDGVIALSNIAADRMLGLAPGGPVGIGSVTALCRAIHEDGLPVAPEEFPWVATLAIGEPIRDLVIGLHAADDVVHWISLDSEPLQREGEMSAYAVITTMTDVSELRESEIALAVAAEELHARDARAVRLTRVYATLSKATQVIGRTIERVSLYEQVCRVIVEQGGLAMAWVGEIDESGWIVPIAHAGDADEYLDEIRVSVCDSPQGRGPTGPRPGTVANSRSRTSPPISGWCRGVSERSPLDIGRWPRFR